MTVAAETAHVAAPERPNLDPTAVMQRAGSENFPVALAVLPKVLRTRLLAIYGYARMIDEIGDRQVPLEPGERLAQLDWAEQELDRALLGQAEHPVFVAVGDVARQLGIDRVPFVGLIEANRLDQRVSRYADYAALEGYCALSANPVGRLVLDIFGASTPATVELSDRVCTALQLVEHFQDVVEDHLAGRIYLPQDDLARFGVTEGDLLGPVSPGLRRLMAFECGRARALLVSGAPLPVLIGGFGRLAISGFIGGGLAQLDALEAAGYDVFGAPVKASKPAVTRAMLRLVVSGRAR
jgi:squalene synthase HpnC